ncbi:MAG: hypothetical protein PW735_02760 [Acidobacteriaceae bacterium]|nr:hypothetical protein [Acidobacteriaceae bacterium]
MRLSCKDVMLRRAIQFVPWFFALPLAAQMHHVDKQEKTTRALAVYEFTGDVAKPTSARLVPVSLFIDGTYENAGTYRANPVPLALDTGNVYELESAGEQKGTLHVTLARNVKDERSEEDDNPVGSWYGYGQFHSLTDDLPKSPKLPAPVKAVALNGEGEEDDKPHFVAARPESDSSAAAAKPKRTPAPAEGDDGEKPTLGKRDDSDDADKKKKKPKKDKPGGYVTGIAGGLNDDPDRPTLGHGRAKSDQVEALTGLPKEMQQVVAVSDPATPLEHVFTRGWSSVGERAQVMDSLHGLAVAQVQAYLNTNALVPATVQQLAASPAASAPASASVSAPGSDELGGPPKLQRTPQGVNTATRATSSAVTAAPAPRAVAGHAGAHKKSLRPVAVPLTLADEQLWGLQLSYGGLPTFVYQADAPVAMKDGTVLQAYVTLVVQQLPAGNLQVALSSTTDSGHMNRVPWLRFIDAVDADGSHRASLLFEQRMPRSRQFALYSLITAKAEPSFTGALLE